MDETSWPNPENLDLKVSYSSAGGFCDVRLYVLLALLTLERLTGGTVGSSWSVWPWRLCTATALRTGAYLVNIFALNDSVGHREYAEKLKDLL